MAVDRGNDAASTHTGMGGRIRKFRNEKGLNLSQLADRAEVSKSYLSALENSDASMHAARRPSAETLYAIAQALGVTMADLLGRKALARPDNTPPQSLIKFANQYGLPAADVRMLSAIKFRGEPPRTVERWQHIYNAIRMSESMDKNQ